MLADGSPDKIYIQLFDSSGTEKGSAIEVYGNYAGCSYSNHCIISRVESTVLKNDDIIVTWNMFAGENLNDVYAKRFNSAGTNQGSEFLVKGANGVNEEDIKGSFECATGACPIK